MKWKTHLIIGKWVGEQLNFDKNDLINFIEGIVAPDKQIFRFCHHNDELLKRIIIRKIIKTRKLFLNGNKKYFYELGVLLHYIQDRFIKKTSFLAHINIEEELEKLAKLKKGIPRQRKYKNIVKEGIKSLNIKEEEKTLLIDPSWTKGIINTLRLAFVNLPKNIDKKLLLNIVTRISFGVARSILDKEPPPLLLQEKVKVINKKIKNKTHKFIFYLLVLEILVAILSLILPIGFIFLFVGVINLFIILPILLLQEKIKNYIKMKDWAISLSILFLISGFVSLFFLYKWEILTILLFIIFIIYLLYPRIDIDEEIKLEINWYNFI